jgi:3'-5' exonuclease
MIVLQNILFLDIETVSRYHAHDQLSDEWKILWNKKAEQLLRYQNNGELTPEAIYGRAAIYAEFGKIICISCGVVQQTDNGIKKLVIKSFSGEDELLLLNEFAEMLNRWVTDDSKYLCAHNGREFDFPFLCRRFIINNLSIPKILQTGGKKPWDLRLLDTMEMWKFGDYKNYTSLELLAHTLCIPTPKDDIDGSMVGDIYWKEKDIARIAAYCQKDVITIVQVYLKLTGNLLIENENIEIK